MTTPLPCPPWCVSPHGQDLPDDELHSHEGVDVHVPALAYDGGDSTDCTASVSLTQIDNPRTGTRSPVGVWFEAGGGGAVATAGCGLRRGDPERRCRRRWWPA